MSSDSTGGLTPTLTEPMLALDANTSITITAREEMKTTTLEEDARRRRCEPQNQSHLPEELVLDLYLNLSIMIPARMTLMKYSSLIILLGHQNLHIEFKIPR